MVGEWWARADGSSWRGRDGVEEPIVIGGLGCPLRLYCILAVARAAHGTASSRHLRYRNVISLSHGTHCLSEKRGLGVSDSVSDRSHAVYSHVVYDRLHDLGYNSFCE
jgi:hypothetical protein